MITILIYNHFMNSQNHNFNYSEAQAETLKRRPDDVDRAATGLLRHTSQALLAGADEVEIEHRGMIYRLRRTSLGKLILTK